MRNEPLRSDYTLSILIERVLLCVSHGLQHAFTRATVLTSRTVLLKLPVQNAYVAASLFVALDQRLKQPLIFVVA